MSCVYSAPVQVRRGHWILWSYRWCEPADMGARNLNPGLHASLLPPQRAFYAHTTLSTPTVPTSRSLGCWCTLSRCWCHLWGLFAQWRFSCGCDYGLFKRHHVVFCVIVSVWKPFFSSAVEFALLSTLTMLLCSSSSHVPLNVTEMWDHPYHFLSMVLSP